MFQPDGEPDQVPGGFGMLIFHGRPVFDEAFNATQAGGPGDDASAPGDGVGFFSATNQLK